MLIIINYSVTRLLHAKSLADGPSLASATHRLIPKNIRMYPQSRYTTFTE
jgi:hypothetical protein